MNRKAKIQQSVVRKKRLSQTMLFSFIFYSFAVLCLFSSCRKSYVPLPYGYFRVDLPEHNYRISDTLNLPYMFDVSTTAKIESRKKQDEKYWIDVYYPLLNARIHCSYKSVDNNLIELTDDAWQFIYTHASKADDIVPSLSFEHPEASVYAVIYDLKGNVASPVQFIITDSLEHFFRGALYFENRPNKDSLAPMVNYIRTDILRLVESFEWTP